MAKDLYAPRSQCLLTALGLVAAAAIIVGCGQKEEGPVTAASGKFEVADDTFDFLTRIDDYIHVEVRKLYPDAQLPTFEYEFPAPDRLVLTYRSARPFAMLADGLIDGSIKHFGDDIDVEMVNLSDGAGTSARFILTRQGKSNG